MICAKPITLTMHQGLRRSVVPCGQCRSCRVNIRRKKTGRFVLEATAHHHSTFLTLTLSDENLTWKQGPDGAPVWSVNPDDVKLFNKRARHSLSRPLRFVNVGEYGEKYGRPHYHALWFGIEAVEGEQVAEKHWGLGNIQARPVNVKRLAYIAGYTAKKMTKHDDSRLLGRHPEFMRQSLKPAIGYPALDQLEETHYTLGGATLLAEENDVASVFRHDGKIWPLDHTLRSRLRERLGVPRTDPARTAGLDVPTPEEQQAAAATEGRLERRAHSPGTVF